MQTIFVVYYTFYKEKWCAVSSNASSFQVGLHEQQAAGRRFTDSATDAAFVISNDGVVAYASHNALQLLAQSEAAMLGANLFSFVQQDFIAALREALTLARLGEPCELLTHFQSAAGTPVRLISKIFREVGTDSFWVVGTNLAKLSRFGHAVAPQPMSLAKSMAAALAHGEFSTYYQPIVSPDGVVQGCEALLRWRKPDGSFISPALFIPAAERSGFILELGEFVLRDALRQLHNFDDAGLPELYMSVNVSPHQLLHPQFVELLTAALDDAGIPPTRLVLEVTEGVSVVDPVYAKSVLTQISNSGIRISLDDYGTGYAGMAYLKTFPVSTLKIDRLFIRDIAEANTQILLQALVNLTKHLGIKTVAEGVETPEQAQALRALNVDALQGYLYGRPMPRDEFMDMFTPGCELQQGTG